MRRNQDRNDSKTGGASRTDLLAARCVPGEIFRSHSYSCLDLLFRPQVLLKGFIPSSGFSLIMRQEGCNRKQTFIDSEGRREALSAKETGGFHRISERFE